LANRFAGDHAGGDFLDHVGHFGVDGAFAVNRLAQGIHHAANQFRADWYFQNTAGAFDRIAFGDVFIVTQNHRAD